MTPDKPCLLCGNPGERRWCCEHGPVLCDTHELDHRAMAHEGPVPERQMPEKRRFLKLPSELGDGVHWAALHIDDALDSLKSWWDENAEIGDTVTLEVVELTQAEFEAIPEI